MNFLTSYKLQLFQRKCRPLCSLGQCRTSSRCPRHCKRSTRIYNLRNTSGKYEWKFRTTQTELTPRCLVPRSVKNDRTVSGSQVLTTFQLFFLFFVKLHISIIVYYFGEIFLDILIVKKTNFYNV